MRLPIKLNKAGWPSPFADLFLAFHDPRPLAYKPFAISAAQFSASVSSLQFGVTFKTTHPGRHAQSNRFLRETYRGSRPVILDVGASDGSTSLDLIQELGSNFAYYYVTDLNLSVRCGYDSKGVVYFVDQNGSCILRASERLLVYSNTSRARFPSTDCQDVAREVSKCGWLAEPGTNTTRPSQTREVRSTHNNTVVRYLCSMDRPAAGSG